VMKHHQPVRVAGRGPLGVEEAHREDPNRREATPAIVSSP
jgi:hypothetical protein